MQLAHALGTALRTLGLWLLIIAGTLVLCALFLTRCASGPQPDPSPEHPRIACIAQSLGDRINPRTGGKVLPEIVRLIGRTSPEDGERWMVVRGVYDREACVSDIRGAACGWLPYDSDQIRVGALCGAEAKAHMQLDR